MEMKDINIEVESILNRPGDILPYGYYNPLLEGKLTWICGEDEKGKITSVFCHKDGDKVERQCRYLENINEAMKYRDELVKDGWGKIVPPKIEFKSE